jgi:large subunit ribosomal protein L4
VSTPETLALPVLSLSREQVGTVEVPAPLIAGPVRAHLLHEAVKSQRASWRAGTHKTKTRGEVRGGGKKPWRQKGTGRARAGSIRSPIWPGGGTIFGPQPRDYDYRLPRGARRAALRSALATRHGEGRLTVIEAFTLSEPKTKRVVEALRGLGLEGSTLLVVPDMDATVLRAARNLPDVKVLAERGVTVFDILGHRNLLVTRAALEQLAGRMGAGA